jgi:hypothetical protein
MSLTLCIALDFLSWTLFKVIEGLFTRTAKSCGAVIYSIGSMYVHNLVVRRCVTRHDKKITV